MERLLSPDQAAQYLGVAKKTIHELCRRGELGYVKIDGKRRMFTAEQLQAYIESRTVEPRVAQPGQNRVSSTRKGGERTKKSLENPSRQALREEMRAWRS